MLVGWLSDLLVDSLTALLVDWLAGALVDCYTFPLWLLLPRGGLSAVPWLTGLLARWLHVAGICLHIVFACRWEKPSGASGRLANKPLQPPVSTAVPLG